MSQKEDLIIGNIHSDSEDFKTILKNIGFEDGKLKKYENRPITIGDDGITLEELIQKNPSTVAIFQKTFSVDSIKAMREHNQAYHEAQFKKFQAEQIAEDLNSGLAEKADTPRKKI